jgi:hypothetical protein
MSNLANRPQKTRQMLERYQKLRRKQLQYFAGIAVLIVATAALGVMLYLFLSALGQTAAAPSTGRPSVKPRKPQYARICGNYELNPAPWFIATDDTKLYVGLDSTLAQPSAPPWPVDTLQAFSAGGAKPVWESKQAREFNWFSAANGIILGLRQTLGTPAGFELTAFSGEDGHQVWQAIEDRAEDCILAVDQKVAVIAYYQNGLYRIVGYNAATGVKSWVRTIKIGMRTSQEFSTTGSELELVVTQGAVVYRLDNQCGVLASGTGELLREITAKGYVYLVQYDKTSQLVYVVSADKDAKNVLVQAVPLSGRAVELYRFAAINDNLLLLGEQGYALLAYGAAVKGDKPGTTKLICFAANDPEPVLTHEFPNAIVWDMVALPSMPGEFLVSVCRGLASSGMPAGDCELHRLRVADKSEWMLKRLPGAAELWPFKDDCLILVQDGQVLSYRGSGKLKQVRRMPYHNLEMPSMTPTRLVISSEPDDYLKGKPGQRLQVLVLE